jgi:hypothetical protein
MRDRWCPIFEFIDDKEIVAVLISQFLSAKDLFLRGPRSRRRARSLLPSPLERETLRHLGGDRRWHDEFRSRDDGIDKNRTLMVEGISNSVIDIGGICETDTAHTHRLCHCREVWIVELGPKIEEACGLLLELDEAECAVIEHDDFHGQLELGEADKISQSAW